MKNFWAMLLVAALFLTACSPNETDSVKTDDTSKVSGEIKKYNSYKAKINYETGDVSLPIDAYRVNGNYDLAIAFMSYREEMISECYFEAKNKLLESGKPEDDEMLKQRREFGIWNLDYASKYGYGTSEKGAKSKMFSNLSEEDNNPEFQECHAEFFQKNEDFVNFIQGSSVGDEISDTSYNLTLNDAAYKKYAKKVEECFESAGYKVNNREGGVYPEFDIDSDKKTQVMVATIEAKCKVETGYIENSYNIMGMHQMVLMEEKEAVLAEIKIKIDDYMKRSETEL